MCKALIFQISGLVTGMWADVPSSQDCYCKRTPGQELFSASVSPQGLL